MTINLTGKIDQKMFGSLCNCLNSLEEDEVLRIYFDSEGGIDDYRTAFIDLLNHNKDRIELVGFCQLYSAAFDIFLFAECKKIVFPSCLGMCHQFWRRVDTFANGKVYGDAEKLCIPHYKKQIEERFKTYKKFGLTDKEIKKVRNGEDVYFLADRLNEIIEWQKENQISLP